MTRAARALSLIPRLRSLTSEPMFSCVIVMNASSRETIFSWMRSGTRSWPDEELGDEPCGSPPPAGR